MSIIKLFGMSGLRPFVAMPFDIHGIVSTVTQHAGRESV